MSSCEKSPAKSVHLRHPSSPLWYRLAALRAPTTVGRTALVLCALLVLLLPATGGADRAIGLRATPATIRAREQAALLQLYALSSRLDRARGELADVDGRLASLGRRRASALRRLRVARATFALAQSHLGQQLRMLYVQDNPGPLAIIFGATSLDEVITGLDSLSRAARSTSSVIAQTTQARATISRLLRSLQRKGAELDRLRGRLAAGAAELVAARSARTAYIERLRTEQRLTAGRIAALQARAQAAQAVSTVATVKAQTVTSLSVFGPSPPATGGPQTPSAPIPVQPASGSGTRLTVTATAYSLPGHTSSGLPVGPGVVAVDPTIIPLGTRMLVPGYGEGIAADTGTAIKGLRIDLWFSTLRQAQAWGSHVVTVTLR